MNVDQIVRVPRMGKSHKRSYKGKQKSNDSLKVVYISSPMKVKTSASRFRALVQQLTGKNSNITQYMDGATDFYDDRLLVKETSDPSHISPYDSSTPTSSDSLTGSMDSIFLKEQIFDGIFSSDSLYDPSELDVLGSFDELL